MLFRSIFIFDRIYILMAALTALAAIPGIKTVYTTQEGAALNQTLAFTGKLLIFYGILFSIGWII